MAEETLGFSDALKFEFRKVFGGGVRALPCMSLSPVQATSAFQGHNRNKLIGDGSVNSQTIHFSTCNAPKSRGISCHSRFEGPGNFNS